MSMEFMMDGIDGPLASIPSWRPQSQPNQQPATRTLSGTSRNAHQQLRFLLLHVPGRLYLVHLSGRRRFFSDQQPQIGSSANPILGLESSDLQFTTP